MVVRMAAMRNASMRAFGEGLIWAVAGSLVTDVMIRVFYGYWLTLLDLALTIAVWGLADLCYFVVRHVRAGRRPDGT
jgi:hypothetical protein